MKVALGSDHRGFALKEKLKPYLERLGYKTIDKGTFSKERSDYPDFAFLVAEAVQKGTADLGILICATGIGMSIAANKVKDIRAGLCLNTRMARLCREHNNANVLCLGADLLTVAQAKRIVRVFLEAKFAGGRHSRRLKKIASYEQSS
ncbi:MAG: ribose 5-phosphate isomerase B [candidate division WOR-3 bacterium]